MDQKIIAQFTKVLKALRDQIPPVRELLVKDFLGRDAQMMDWFAKFLVAKKYNEEFATKCRLTYHGKGAFRKIIIDSHCSGKETVFPEDALGKYMEHLNTPPELAAPISAECAPTSSSSVVAKVASRSIATMTLLQRCAGVSQRPDYFEDSGCDMKRVLQVFIRRHSTWFCISCPQEVLNVGDKNIVRCADCAAVHKDKKRATSKLQPLVAEANEDPFSPSLGTFITGFKNVALSDVDRITTMMRLMEVHQLHLSGGFVLRDDGVKIYTCVGLVNEDFEGYDVAVVKGLLEGGSAGIFSATGDGYRHRLGVARST